jgi:HipA N-terminal domain
MPHREACRRSLTFANVVIADFSGCRRSQEEQMTKRLIVLLDGKETGRIARDNRGKLTLTYDETSRNADNAYPISISMPLHSCPNQDSRKLNEKG